MSDPKDTPNADTRGKWAKIASRHRATLPLATALTGVAILPFLAGLYYVFTGSGNNINAQALRWLLVELALIISFTSGAQWGRMLTAKQAPPLDMALAVLAPLIAWPGLLLTGPWSFVLLLVALVVAWLTDENGARSGWQAKGFLHLRRLATLIVFICTVVIGWRVAWG